MGEVTAGSRRTAAELVACRQVLQTVIDAPVPMLVFVGSELRCHANELARELLPPGVEGQSLDDVRQLWAAWEGFAADVAAVAAGAPLLVAERLVARSGAALLTLTPLAQGRGVLVQVNRGHCVGDATERKEAEIALKLANETLEKEVGKRTEALTRAELALQRAQRVEALGRLTGGIAHDFNNLLGAMLGYFDLIARRPAEASRVRDLAQAGRRAVERGARLTSQLLAFSRTQAIELRPVALGEVLEGMRDMLNRTLGPLVAVEIQVGCGNSLVLSDPTQLEMAMLNLAINARDAMPGDGRLVLASARRTITNDAVLPPGDYVELTAADDGTGMPADVAERAFDPFFTTKRVGKGTGLGLSQVFGIARQAGGVARLCSAPGHGTVVTMTLPVTTERAPARAECDKAAAVAAHRAAMVLVVDDDPDLRQVLALSLEDLGYAVLEAESGAAALDVLAARSPDAIIADFAMPGMTGAELALAARRHQPDLPLIIASGYADAVPLEAVAGPRVRLLRKPFRLDELRDALALVLAGQG